MTGTAGSKGGSRSDTATAFLRTEPLIEPDGSLEAPVRVIDLDAADLDPALVDAELLRRRLLIGVARSPLTPTALEVARRLDTTFVPIDGDVPRCAVAAADPANEAERLAERASTWPLTSLVLAELLRVTETLNAKQSLSVESLAYSTLLAGPEFDAWLKSRARKPPVPAPEAPVVVEREGGQLRIRLSHPERRNAYSVALRDRLVEALLVAVVDPTVDEIDVRGDGPTFCAGGDLDDFGTAADPVFAHLVRSTVGAAGLFEALSDRLLVWVHGPCFGAGVELPAFAGRVVAAPGTTFCLPELAMGLIPGAGGTTSIPRRIGRWRTAYLALSGDRLDVGTALDWNLVDAIGQP